MKKTFKKAFSVFLAMALLTVLVAGVALSASAHFSEEYCTWTGEGDASFGASLEHTRFVKLTYDGKEVDPSNYIVTEGSNDTSVIKLKEEYLKTLNLDNGCYYFSAYFTPSVEAVYEYTIDLNEQNEGIIPTGLIEMKFVKLCNGDKEVDPTNYTVTFDEVYTIITLKQEYLDTLDGDYYFIAYLADDIEYAMVFLGLTVDVQTTTTTAITTEISTTTTTEIVSSVPFQDTDDNPKTGDSESMASLFVILSLSAVSCAVALMARRTKNDIA